MSSIELQIAQLEQAITAQESLRPVIGDAAVDLTVTALRGQVQALRQQAQGAASTARPDPRLEQLQGYLPGELAEKMRTFDRVDSERKQVTVLFADISGFTALSERLDPEEGAAMTDAVLKELARAVYECEGYIDKFIGDAVMAVFGAPIAHEDDPDRALRAALSMRENLEHFNRLWIDRVGAPLTLHIGINTGLVIAGNVGSDLRFSYTVMGDTVNTASRLESAARPGQILVSRSTYRLTEESFAFVEQGPIQVKGKREPLVVYELHHARLTPGKTRGLKDFAPVFVERERELAALQALTDELVAGRGHVVVVTGDAGIGKSRLTARWRAGSPRALRWLEGRSFPHTTSLPYGPFRDLFLRHVSVGDDDREELVRQRLRALVERSFGASSEAHALFASMLALHTTAEEDAVLAGLSAERRRHGLFALVRQWLQDLTREAPVVLVLEDMHWADAASVELAESLLPLVAGERLLIAGLLRASEVPRVFQASVTAQHAAPTTHLRLAPISERGSVTMVQGLLQTATLPDAIEAIILRKAEGNPFFIEEVLRMLVERAALVRAPGGDSWVATASIGQVSIPDTLHGVLMARIDRLYPETRWVVQQAAVIGRVFLYRVLSQMAASEHIEVDIRLLEREGLVRERSRQPEVEYIFKHALTQEVAYQSLLAPRRKELHRRVGAVMEALFADRLAEFYPIVGRHFLLGEQWDRALDYLGRSGAAAARLYAHVEARIHYGEALEALEHLPPSDDNQRAAIDLTLALVKVSQVADEPGVNLARLARIEALARGLLGRSGGTDDRLRLARVELQQGNSLVLYGDQHAAAMACFERVLPVAQELQDEELLVGPSTTIGMVMVTRGLFRDAIPLFRRVLEPLARGDDVTAWILASVFLGLAEAAVGRWQEGLRVAELALARAVATNNATGQTYGHTFLAVIAVHIGDMPRVLAESRQALLLAEASRNRMYCYFSYAYQALAHSRLGDHVAADECLARQHSLADSLGGNLVTGDWFAATESEIALNAGRVATALALARTAIGLAAAVGGVFSKGLAHRACAQAMLAAGDAPRADIDEQFAASIDHFTRGGAVLELARTYALWGHADPDGAGTRWSRALELYQGTQLEAEAAPLREALATRGRPALASA